MILHVYMYNAYNIYIEHANSRKNTKKIKNWERNYKVYIELTTQNGIPTTVLVTASQTGP